MIKDARTRGEVPLVVYHSHPESPARLSNEDLRLLKDPTMIYVIISLEGTEPDLKGYRVIDGEISDVKIHSRRLQMSVNNVNLHNLEVIKMDFMILSNKIKLKRTKNKDTFNADDVTAKIIDKAKGKKGSTDSVSAAAGTGAFSSTFEFFGIASAGKKKMAELKQRDRQQKNAISAASVDLKRAKWDNQSYHKIR